MACQIVLAMLIGRVWEMWDTSNTGAFKPIHLSLSDGGDWYAHAIQDGYYNTGQLPQLGAVICFDKPGGSGHVAVVEAMGTSNGRNYIVTSNSAWQSTYFYLQTLYEDENYSWGSYNFQGFIYCYDNGPTPPTPTTRKQKGFKWVLYANRIRNRNLNFLK